MRFVALSTLDWQEGGVGGGSQAHARQREKKNSLYTTNPKRAPSALSKFPPFYTLHQAYIKTKTQRCNKMFVFFFPPKRTRPKMFVRVSHEFFFYKKERNRI